MEYQRIERMLFGSVSTENHHFRAEEMEANARQIFGEAFPDLQRRLLLVQNTLFFFSSYHL